MPPFPPGDFAIQILGAQLSRSRAGLFHDKPLEIRKQRAAFSLKLAASMTATLGAGVVNDYLILQYANLTFGLCPPLLPATTHGLHSAATSSDPMWSIVLGSTKLRVVSKLSDECRAKATEYDKKATEAKDIEAKRLLQGAAQESRSMAAEADQKGF
jgi:hypothetical protein